MSEFPTKQWSRAGLNRLLRKIDATGSAERRPGQGRKRSVRTQEKIDNVGDLVLSQDNNPQTHRTQREISRELGISRGSVNRIVRRDLRLQCFKKRKASELTAANKQVRLERARELLKLYPRSLVNFIFFTDEKVFTVARPSNSQNDRVYAAVGTTKKNIPACRLLRTRSHFSRSVMVSVGVSVLGVTGLHFVNPGVKVNGQYYRDTLLKEELLPDIRDISEFFIFQQDNAPAHRARATVDLLSTETPAFIPPTLWPPNSPDLNPVDYKLWSVIQEQVYKVKVNNVDELRQRIQTVWDELDQRVIDKAIKQWRTRLRACVKAKGGHFEHKL